MLVSKFIKKIYHFYIDNFKIIGKHLVVSFICASSEFLIFIFLFNNMNSNLFLSHFLSFITATALGFIGHSFYTFKIGYLYKKNLYFFIIQALISLNIGFILLYTFINILNFESSISKFLQLCLIFNFNFIYGKFISFKKR